MAAGVNGRREPIVLWDTEPVKLSARQAVDIAAGIIDPVVKGLLFTGVVAGGTALKVAVRDPVFAQVIDESVHNVSLPIIHESVTGSCEASKQASYQSTDKSVDGSHELSVQAYEMSARITGF